MNIELYQNALNPGQVVIRQFMIQFEKLKACFMETLLIQQPNLCITTYRNGSNLYIDIIYDSVTQGTGFVIEFKMKILVNITVSIKAVNNLFRLVLYDMITPTTTPFQGLLSTVL